MEKLKRPKVTVAAIIIKNGKILLEKRKIQPFKGYWCLPGGHVEFGEKALDAVKREVKEETGLIATNCRFLFYQDEILKNINWHSVVLIFSCSIKKSQLIKGDEVMDLEWFDIKSVLKLKLAFRHRKIISEFIKLAKNSFK